jgi:hypothetical protein
VIAAAVVLILLHGPDGHEIRINPHEVTSLRSAKPGEEGKHFAEEVHCMVSLADGKFVTVVEQCADIQKLMEELK